MFFKETMNNMKELSILKVDKLNEWVDIELIRSFSWNKIVLDH
jgi:hypothetical protein